MISSVCHDFLPPFKASYLRPNSGHTPYIYNVSGGGKLAGKIKIFLTTKYTKDTKGNFKEEAKV
jgi:hypothetical protein